MSDIPRHIVFITSNYPSPAHPTRGTFVEQFVKSITRKGVCCTVIHPRKVLERARPTSHKYGVAKQSPDNDGIKVIRPLYPSFSSKAIGPFNTFQATHWFFARAVHKAVRGLAALPDAIYGHFLYSAGAAAAWVGRRQRIPSFVAVGESSFWSVTPLGTARAKHDFSSIAGALAVSSALKRGLIANIGIPAERISVFPNGIDTGKFYPRDREATREKLGLPQDLFLVAFLGHFDDRKGVLRVAQAVDKIEGVGTLFIGQGQMNPTNDNGVFQGTLPHELVPEMLSAADVFVLPTLAEGSCNAIVEALACGLPVVTSDGEFNDDIVDGSVSIRVDPRNVSAIRQAILRLKQDKELRESMARNALEKSKHYNIDDRAGAALKWMGSVIANYAIGKSPA